jgi:hypothetical protein
MSISKIKTGSITADAVSTSKIATDAITEAKIADNAISEEHLDATVITGNTELAEAAAGTDVLLVYDASAGTLKKIQASNVGLQAPSVTSVSPTSVLSGDGTGNYTFTITGSGYIASAVPTLITNGGASVSFDSFTIDSSTQITAVIAKSSLTHANEPYDVRVTTAGALSSTLENQINVDASPIFNTASGSVGVFSEQSTISTIDIEAYDPDSAGNVTFELQSGSLPAGLSASTVHENGVSKYRITGTLTTDQSSFTTTNFTLRAVDAASNTSSRAFSISESPSGVESFTSSGTFSVPTGITTVDVLVVAGGAAGGVHHGGGGGAGGLIFVPNYSVTPGGTITVTVGCGGGQPNNYPAPDNPGGQTGASGQDSVFDTLTAKGGGGGGAAYSTPGRYGVPGGSGGGGAAPGPSTPAPGGTATQPTQPGQSGAYGFGNPGGPDGGNTYASGGGGGAGAAGAAGGPTGGNGGAGKAYTISDGTTPVYYAGGGGGAYYQSGTAGQGGQGGGGQGGAENEDNHSARFGAANKGGGGGGADRGPGPNGAGGGGGKGIVIVSY